MGFTIVNFGYLALAWRQSKKKTPLILFLYGSSALLGVMMMTRSYEVVRVVTVLTILVVNIIISAWQREKKIESRLIDMAVTVFLTIINTGKVLIEEVSGVIGQEKVKNEKKWIKILSGVALSVPMVLVFLLFFSQSDPIFYKLLTDIKWPKIETGLIVDVGLSIFFGGMVAAMIGAKTKKGWRIRNYFEKIEGLEVAVVILQGLFVIFSVVQLRYFLVSGDELKAMGINFSDYTRRGYGEMLFTCFLAMGVMWMIGEMKGFEKRKGLVKLYATEIWLFVATATRRNYFYQANNGFTRVRLWGFGLSLLITAMVIVLLVKIVKEKGEVFWAKGVLVLIVSFILVLNLANIDGLIAKRPAKINGKIDYNYLTGMSSDAWPIWEKMLTENEAKEEEEDNLEAVIVNHWFLWKKDRLEKQASANWQNWGSWNKSAVKALEFLRENEGRLKENQKLIEEGVVERGY